jgi:hypothetical protein
VNGVCSGDCAPLTRCGRTCIDTEGDRLNCGGCGNVCPSGVCIGGSCDASCEAPRLGGYCDPLAQCGCEAGSRCDAVNGPYDGTGPEHCLPAGAVGPMGGCDETAPATTCGPGLTCVPTAAVWEPGMPPFPDSTAGICRGWCLLGDDSTCDPVGGGMCAQLSGQSIYGVCYPYMEPETCNGVDDDLDANIDYLGPNFDPYNCGYCGAYCDSGSCFEGACQRRCEDSFLTTCPDGSCADTQWNRWSCGSCRPTGATCAINETCHDGRCMPGDVGDPCEEATNCSGILTESLCAYELLGWGIPDGYCTRECDPGARPDPCPFGSRCVPHPTTFPLTGYCIKTCPAGDSGVCRQSQGYQCVGDGTGIDYFCLPVGTREPTDG